MCRGSESRALAGPCLLTITPFVMPGRSEGPPARRAAWSWRFPRPGLGRSRLVDRPQWPGRHLCDKLAIRIVSPLFIRVVQMEKPDKPGDLRLFFDQLGGFRGTYEADALQAVYRRKVTHPEMTGEHGNVLVSKRLRSSAGRAGSFRPLVAGDVKDGGFLAAGLSLLVPNERLRAAFGHKERGRESVRPFFTEFAGVLTL